MIRTINFTDMTIHEYLIYHFKIRYHQMVRRRQYLTARNWKRSWNESKRIMQKQWKE